MTGLRGRGFYASTKRESRINANTRKVTFAMPVLLAILYGAGRLKSCGGELKGCFLEFS
jgi:hypothetical protein